jgi:protein SCO1
MRTCWTAWFSVAVAFALVAAGCRGAAPKSDQRSVTLQGQILSLDVARKSAQIKHDEIKGFMPAMTMPYEVRDQQLLEGLAPGDLVTATLVVESNAAYLSTIEKTGTAPLESPPPDVTAPSASAGFELLKPGEPAPAARLVDQDGRVRNVESFSGRPVVLTFMYTKCPMPTFCPLLDRNFAAMQRSLETDQAFASLKGKVHLVSVSFDPITDTPAVLKAHAEKLSADPEVWTFLTGDRDEVDRFAARFGVQIARNVDNPLDITHNLRTAVLDADGKLVTTYVGNEWTPEQVLNDLKPLVSGR